MISTRSLRDGWWLSFFFLAPYGGKKCLRSFLFTIGKSIHLRTSLCGLEFPTTIYGVLIHRPTAAHTVHPSFPCNHNSKCRGWCGSVICCSRNHWLFLSSSEYICLWCFYHMMDWTPRVHSWISSSLVFCILDFFTGRPLILSILNFIPIFLNGLLYGAFKILKPQMPVFKFTNPVAQALAWL